MKISEEILKRNITKFTAFDEEDNPSIPYKDALKAVQEAIQLAKNNESLHDVSHCGLTEEEQEERRDLMMLRADSTRFFHQCELDRLNEINDKMFKNSKNPHCG